MKEINFYCLFLITALLGCNGAAFWKDENIASETKQEINKLNDQIIDGFIQGKQNLVLEVCSEKLKDKSKDDLLGLIMQVGNTLDKSHFKIKNQFQIKNTSEGALTQAMSGLSGDKDYIIKYQIESKESFITVGYFESDHSSLAFTTVYEKNGSKWELDILNIGQLTIDNKDAYDWYRIAKNNYDKGYLVDAANDIAILSQILQPAGKYWQYQKEQEMKSFIDRVMAEINNRYKFPLVLDHVSSKPEIFRIAPQPIDEGIFPFVLYTTKIDIGDTASLAKECDNVHERIGNTFPGLDKNNKYIFYRAYNKVPRDGDTTRYFGMIRKNQ
jgi:hypothetical protein